jgi:hypothetical protein
MQFRIVNLRTDACDVRMDRKTQFGNPFFMHGEWERDSVCEKFDAYLEAHPKLMQAFRDAVKQHEHKDVVRLGCWCAPKRCHVLSYIRRW